MINGLATVNACQTRPTAQPTGHQQGPGMTASVTLHEQISSVWAKISIVWPTEQSRFYPARLFLAATVNAAPEPGCVW